MKRIRFSKYLIAAVCLIFSGQVYAQDTNEPQESKSQVTEFLNGIEMSGNWYFSYRHIFEEVPPAETVHTNDFVLKRSYFTLKKDLNDVFSVRYTQDLTVDREGGDAGNVETRLKYLYVKAKIDIDSDILTNTWAEVGMVHTPWLDYEQDINTYRVQNQMPSERNRLFNSADFGFVVGGNIGAKMDSEFLDNVSDAMSGKYLSYMFGFYNGGGYSGLEMNNNKVFSARISVRPLPDVIPEVHFSGMTSIGKGNIPEAPEYQQFLVFAAYTGKQLTLNSQYHNGTGDFGGRYTDPADINESLTNHGYSFFGEYKIPKTNFAVWGRYDHFYIDTIERETNRYIGGIAYRINKNLRLVLDTEAQKIDDEKDNIYELNLEISF